MRYINLHFTYLLTCVEVWYTSNLRPLGVGEEKKERKKKKDRNRAQGKNIMACPITNGGHNRESQASLVFILLLLNRSTCMPITLNRALRVSTAVRR